jgi:hypothetical protein
MYTLQESNIGEGAVKTLFFKDADHLYLTILFVKYQYIGKLKQVSLILLLI